MKNQKESLPAEMEWEVEEINVKAELQGILELIEDWEFREAKEQLKILIKQLQ